MTTYQVTVLVFIEAENHNEVYDALNEMFRPFEQEGAINDYSFDAIATVQQ